MARTVWDSSVGKKTVMAVSGLIMLLYLVAHMLGNLKIFFGPGIQRLRALAAHDRRALHALRVGLWLVRVVLVAAVVAARASSAYQLSRARHRGPAQQVRAPQGRGRATRPGPCAGAGSSSRLFIVWHLLDLTTGTVQPGGFQPGHPYQNVVDTFSTWYGNVIYIVAMLALGLHIRHGFWSAAQTLGVGSRTRDRALKTVANVLALLLTAGFIAVPVGVMTGVVS